MKSPKLLRIYALMCLQGILMAAELFASQLTHSLILLADGYHNLYSIMTMLLLVISYKMTNEQTLKNTFGWARIEVLGMLVNVTFIAALSFSLLVEGIQQIVHASHEIAHPTNYIILLAFGTCGLICNFLCFVTIRDFIRSSPDVEENITSVKRFRTPGIEETKMEQTDNTQASTSAEVKTNLLEEQSTVSQPKKKLRIEALQCNCPACSIFRDFSSSLLLLICGLITKISKENLLAKMFDPVLGIIVAIIICFTIYPTMKNTGLILLQTVPQNVDVARLKKKMLREFPTIMSIHELHIWCLNNSQIVATCHIILSPDSASTYVHFSKSLKTFFDNEGICLATVQPEFGDFATEKEACLMECSKITNNNCDPLTCCKANKDKEKSNGKKDSEKCSQVVCDSTT